MEVNLVWNQKLIISPPFRSNDLMLKFVHFLLVLVTFLLHVQAPKLVINFNQKKTKGLYAKMTALLTYFT